MRRLSLLLGVVSVAVGAWALRHAHTSTLFCTPHSGGTGGYGLTNSCVSQLWLEFVSFALIIGGAVVATIALMLMRRGREGARQTPNAELRLLGTPGEHPELRRQLAAGLIRLPLPEVEPDEPGVERLPKPGRDRPDSRQVS